MDTQRFFRLSGLALVIGGVVSFVFQLGSVFFYGDTTSYATQPLFITDNVVLAASTIVVLFGLPGVYASRAQGFGKIGLVGVALIFATGSTLGLFFPLLGAIVFPWLSTQAPSLANSSGPPGFFPFFIIGSVFLVVGAVLLAIPLLRGRVAPRWAAFVLLLSAVAGVVSFFATAGPSNSLVSSLVGVISPILLFIAFIALGYETWRHPTPPPTDPSPPTTAEVAAQP